MPIHLPRLFRHRETARDGLTQPQREAIADLLYFCEFADNHIALAEDQVVDETIASLSWDPNISVESYEALSLGKVREAKADPSAADEFFVSVRSRLNSPAARELALSVCKKLFLADGAETEKETQLLATLRKVLG
ncbi:MAG TPA: hypothetical protein VGD81_05165 [Opitutaceae bacterium]